MLLQNLSQELLADAKEEAHKVGMRAQEEAALIREQAQEEANQYLKEKKLLYEQERLQLDNQAITRAQGDAKKVLLQAQHNALADIREQVRTRVYALNKEEKVRLYKYLLSKAQEVIDPEHVVCSSEDEALIKTITKKTIKAQKGFVGLRLVNGAQSVHVTFEDLITQQLQGQEQSILEELTRL